MRSTAALNHVRVWVVVCVGLLLAGCEVGGVVEGDGSCTGDTCGQVCNSSSDCPNADDTCSQGRCVPVENATCRVHEDCVEPDPCELSAGALCVQGECVYQRAAIGADCSDNNECTSFDRCDDRGRCVGIAKTCDEPPASPVCAMGDSVLRTYETEGTCAPDTGECIYDSNDSPCAECSMNCLACRPCTDFQGGCRVSSTCSPETDYLCEYESAIDLTQCDLHGQSDGVCATGTCVECFPEGNRNCSYGDVEGGVCSGGVCHECLEHTDCELPPGMSDTCASVACVPNQAGDRFVCQVSIEPNGPPLAGEDPCSETTCTDGIQYLDYQCQGGACVPTTSVSCGEYACQDDACFTNCAPGLGHCGDAYECDGTTNVCRGALEFGVVPQVTNVTASAATASADATLLAHTNVTGGPLYVRWHVADDDLAAGPITVLFGTDDETWTEVATDLENTAGAGCTIDATRETGCYRWDSPPSDGAVFRVRVSAEDADGNVVYGWAPQNNLGAMRLVAGDGDPGWGGHGSDYVFTPRLDHAFTVRVGTLAYGADRSVYFLEPRGLVAYLPGAGTVRLLVPTTGVYPPVQGALADATLYSPRRLALDHQGRLLILDAARIHRVDTKAQPMTLTTIVGGPGANQDGTVGTSVPAAAFNLSPGSRERTFFALPDGRVVFESGHHQTSPADGSRLRIYEPNPDPALAGVVHTTIAGEDNSQPGVAPTGALSTCRVMEYGAEFSLGSEPSVTRFLAFTDGACGMNHTVALDPITMALRPDPIGNDASLPTHLPRFTAPSGRVYGIDGYGGLIKRLNGADWDDVLTGSTATCTDGTPQNACADHFHTAAVSGADEVIFLALDDVRRVVDPTTVTPFIGRHRPAPTGILARESVWRRVRHLGRWWDATNGVERVVAYTADGIQLWEFALGDATATLELAAGTGGHGNWTGGPPRDEALSSNSGGVESDFVAVDELTGDLFVGTQPIDGQNRVGWFARQPDGSLLASLLVGGGAVAYHTGSDGLVGSDISLGGYTPRPWAVLGTHVAVTQSGFDAAIANFSDAFIKSYDVADSGRQAHVAGTNGAAVRSCPDVAPGNPLDPDCVYDSTNRLLCYDPVRGHGDGVEAASCRLPGSGQWGMSTRVAPAPNQSDPGRWLLAALNERVAGFMSSAGVFSEVVLEAGVQSIAYNSADDVIYYCASGGTLRRHNVGTGNDTALPRVPGAPGCSARTLLYSPTHHRLIFPVTLQNGLQGVAEVHLGPSE